MMKAVMDWLEEYSQITKNLLDVLDAAPEGYSDGKLASVEAAVQLRQESLEELAKFTVSESERRLYGAQLEEIKSIESEIEERIKTMMSELDAERVAVQDQRSELNRLQKANRSYAGTVKSTEGYFIDKKK